MAVFQPQYDDYYEFIDIMGKGTFGEVWKACQGATGNLVAIKIIRNSSPTDYQITHELNLLKAIEKLDPEQAHIVHFIKYFSDVTNYYLVFEHLHLDLSQYQKMNNFAPVPVRHIRTITSQILEALAKLNEISIIHADLKPQNIMLVDQVKYPFKIKVIDFGNANILNEVKYLKEPYVQSRYYRAPEILLGLPFNEKMDMWSLGCIMAELHLGCPLYPGSNEYDQMRYICEMQGLPQSYMLEAASKSFRFFNRWINMYGGVQWTLKTTEEYQLETRVRPTEMRKFLFNSLDKIASVNTPKSNFSALETIAEYYDLKTMVGLIRKMLAWDSHNRISASEAMKHPFITLQHLRALTKNTQYYQLSRQCPYKTTKNNQNSTGKDNDAYERSITSPNLNVSAETFKSECEGNF